MNYNDGFSNDGDSSFLSETQKATILQSFNENDINDKEMEEEFLLEQNVHIETSSSNIQLIKNIPNEANDNLPFSRTKLLIYIFLALTDVEANYFGKFTLVVEIKLILVLSVVKAYQYTSITSIMFLDTSVIPWVMIFSKVFLGAHYNLRQLIAILICLLGMTGIILSDYYFATNESEASRPALGDFFCLLSSLLYAISNVGGEFLLKKYQNVPLWRGFGSQAHIIRREWHKDSDANLLSYSRVEFLTCIGVFGFFISFLQL
jgi:drug/metabolite transporter (DMT)-like permease